MKNYVLTQIEIISVLLGINVGLTVDVKEGNLCLHLLFLRFLSNLGYRSSRK